MLIQVQIRDFAIIDRVELDFDCGLTVLTGETGAGKSILVDALLLAVGGRAGADAVRHGCDRAEVTVTFAIDDNAAARAWLEEQALEHEGECVLRRVVGDDGRSRAYINGRSMPAQALRDLGERLLDVHGQLEYQSLVRRPAQRELLDRHAGHQVLVDEVSRHWRELRALRSERDAATASARDRASRLELLRYHVSELEALGLRPGEPEELLAESQRLAQRSRLLQGVSDIATLLQEADESSAELTLSRALAVARSLVAIDGELASTARLIEESLIAAREAGSSIRGYESRLELDPGRIEWLEQRLAALESVARKHHVEPASLIATQGALQDELARLEGLELSLERIDKRVADAEHAFAEACSRLGASRREAAVDLSERITTLMQGLGMPGGRFVVEVRALAAEEATQAGSDEIEFVVSANPGQPLRPLAKVASGGELSRISLAIQVASVQTVALPCLVFDEVDAGIGGGVAEIVGRQLRALGERVQVLCVTHLPQVASQAHHHLRVTKLTDGRTTRTALHELSHEERVEEIARMLGGVEVTGTARDHAAELLSNGREATRGSGRRARRRR